LVDPIKNDPRFDAFMEKIEKKFWEKHAEIRRRLVEKELL